MLQSPRTPLNANSKARNLLTLCQTALAGFGSKTAFDAWLQHISALTEEKRIFDVRLLLQIVGKILDEPTEAKWRSLSRLCHLS